MRTVAALLVLVVIASGPAFAQTPRLDDLDGQELNARGLHVLVYHPYPDPQGDPWGFPEREVNGTALGYMEAQYDAYWYPTTVFDGVERVEGAPSFLETYNDYRGIYLERRLEDSPIRLFVHGALEGDEVDVSIRAQDKRSSPPADAELRAVLYEDEVAFDGGNGVDVHRFVARRVLFAGPLAFNATGAAETRLNASLDDSWQRSSLGIVVSLHQGGVPAGTHRTGEVLQATTFRFDQTGPTIQDRRGVLLETLSGTWCDACVYGDGAVDELANEFGVASASSRARSPSYLRPVTPTVPSITTGTWETGLLAFALAAFVLAFAADFSRFDPARRERLVRRSMSGGVVALGVALLTLLLYFLVANLSIDYVFTYTRTDYPWYYRLSGLWAGQKGTLLLWAAATGIFALAFLRRGERAIARHALSPDAPEVLRATRRVLLVILAALTWTTLAGRTFEPTPAFSLAVRPLGNGLQPVLLTPFMIIHPPIQFLSYAMTALLFAAGFAHVATGGTAWAKLARPWARLNWLLATIGLGLGGLWAYYVLNFGGFWAWDPVETANLLAWFPLTLLLHAFIGYERGEHRTVAPLFALLTLPMVLFSTVATRTGLWVSVHAFTDPTENFARDPLVRLLNILATSELLRLLVALLVLSLLASFVAVAIGRVRHAQRRNAWRTLITASTGTAALALLLDPVAVLGAFFEAARIITLGDSAPLGLLLMAFAAVAAVLVTGPETAVTPRAKEGWQRWIEPGPLVTAGILLLGLAFLATLLLDLGGVNGYDRRVFDERAPFVALPILLVLAAHFLRRFGLRIAIAAPVTAAILAGILSLSFPDHAPVLTVMPALLLVAAASLLRLVDVASGSFVVHRRDRAAAWALIVGALLAFAQWGNPPSRLLGYEVAWGWALPAYGLASLALVAGATHAGRPSRNLARVAAVALLPLVGPWGLTSAAGLVALVCLAHGESGTPARTAFLERRSALRKSAVYFLHFGLALGLTGYAFATYESVTTEPFAIGPGSTTVRGYSFEPIGAAFASPDEEQGLPREVYAHVRVMKDGRAVDEATLVYWLVPDGTPGHYDARVTVVRLLGEDLYLFPSAIHLRGQTLTDHINGATPRDQTLEGVELSVKILPGAGLVWSGLWILGLAMVGRLAFGGFDVGATNLAPHSTVAKVPVSPAATQATPVTITEPTRR